MGRRNLVKGRSREGYVGDGERVPWKREGLMKTCWGRGNGTLKKGGLGKTCRGRRKGGEGEGVGEGEMVPWKREGQGKTAGQRGGCIPGGRGVDRSTGEREGLPGRGDGEKPHTVIYPLYLLRILEIASREVSHRGRD